MKFFLGMLCCCIMFVMTFGQTSKTEIAVIPEPVSIVENAGRFSLPKNSHCSRYATGNEANHRFLKDRLSIPRVFRLL